MLRVNSCAMSPATTALIARARAILKTGDALVSEAHGLSTEARDLINTRRGLADEVRDYADHCQTQMQTHADSAEPECLSR